MKFSRKLIKKWLKKHHIHNWRKHPFVLPVVFLMAVFFGLVGFYISLGGKQLSATDSHSVILSHDGKRLTLPTRAKTVGEFLERTGVKINEGDIVEPAQDTDILDENFRINVYRARPVTIIDGERKISAFSAATTARSVAAQSGVTVYPEDELEATMQENFLGDHAIGQKVVINRATALTLDMYGTAATIRTKAKTVGDLLDEKNITLAKDDSLQPTRETPISAGISIAISRSGVRVATVEEQIPMPIQYVEDASLSFGSTAIRQQGRVGKKSATYEIEFKNNTEVSRKLLREVVLEQPSTQIVARGKTVFVPADREAIMAAAGISPSDYGYVNYIISRESGWRTTAQNPSGAYGLCQALPGSKMASAGGDWQTNPVTQLKWCSGYAVGRYGSWGGAYNFWLSF